MDVLEINGTDIAKLLPQHYQVNVVIIEGKLLALTHDSAKIKIHVSIGNRKKIIRAKTNRTDCPFFNDFCSFNFNLPLNLLLDKIVVVKAYQVTKLLRKLIGSFKVELTTVWAQPNHQFYHKWAVLGDVRKSEQLRESVRGFLKCDISILYKGAVRVPDSDEDIVDQSIIEDNLMVPLGAVKDRHSARIIFSIYRADSFHQYLPVDAFPDYSIGKYVKITYAGSILRSKISRLVDGPVWNQELIFRDLIPPLCQNILVEVYDRQNIFQKFSIGNTNIEMSSLCEEGLKGFLPTFGPTFVYLYNPFGKFERHRNGSVSQRYFTYSCRLLMAIRTEVSNYAEDLLVRKKKKKKYFIRDIPPILETDYFEYKNFILFGVVFDIFFFDRDYVQPDINLRLSMGPKRRMGKFTWGKPEKLSPKESLKRKKVMPPPKTAAVDTKGSVTTSKIATLKLDYSYTSFSGKFPCAYVLSEWPDALRKVYRTNVIKKVIINTMKEVNKIKYSLEFEDGRLEQSTERLKSVLSDLSDSCELILPMTRFLKEEDTNLNRQKKKFFQREIAKMARRAKQASQKKVLIPEDELTSIATFMNKLGKYAQDPENSFPDTEIWVLRNNEVSGHIRLRTEDITYSTNCPERGIKSGKIQTVLMRGRQQKVKAKIDILLWFGLATDFVHCLKMLPKGFKDDFDICSGLENIKIPRRLIYKEKHYFTCRVHIFQAKILIGFDDTGLADPFTRILIFGKSRRTKIKRNTLSPIWNETLIFPVIKLYGPAKFIKRYPLTITAEVFDSDRITPKDVVGRSFIVPVVKLIEDKYQPPDFPPKLRWEELLNDVTEVGKILIVSELLELRNRKDRRYVDKPKFRTALGVPYDIAPRSQLYRLEVKFWGVREFKKYSLANNVFVLFECAGKFIRSENLKNLRRRLNFPGNVQSVFLELPEEREFAPPLTVKLFNVSVIIGADYVANCIIPNVKTFLQNRAEMSSKEQKLHLKILEEKKKKEEIKLAEKLTRELTKEKLLKKLEKRQKIIERILFIYANIVRKLKCLFRKKCEELNAYEGEPVMDEEDPFDWWAKYYAAQEPKGTYPTLPILKIYKSELEAQPEFNGFSDFLHTFEMAIKQHGKKKTRVYAKVKAIVDLYKVTDKNRALFYSSQHLERAPTNEPVRYVARVYVVAGVNLPPKDINGKSDPYLVLILGKQRVNERKNYMAKQLNPVFAKCFEFHGQFPKEHLLIIKVIDYDVMAKDDLIGQTAIDLENRYYTKYHASCGLASNYDKEGDTPWRDIFQPRDILKKTCRLFKISEPIYHSDRVIVQGHTFYTRLPKKSRYAEQVQALQVLRRWHEFPGYGFHFVPEHVEARPLYNPSMPGVEQGKLHMWVDIFPSDYRYMPPKIDITPKEPVPMELRAIVWNVDGVVLDDRTFFFNEKMSDIYVKGWVLSLEEEIQKTDIHFRSLNGEGSFNWRFVFHFNYIQTERKIVVAKKKNALDLNPEKVKHQCKLEIQIWDNDAFGDDYLGTLILELAAMPRGAKLSSRCSLKMLAPNAAKINLFKIKKTRGWWPFRRLRENRDDEDESQYELTGKIDLELEVLTEVEATRKPAGQGREEPNALPPPIRPETSFNWLLSPLKALKFIVLKKFIRLLIWACVIVVAVLFILMTLSLIPSLILQKVLHII